MGYPRKDIRKAVIARLKEANTESGIRVYTNRIRPIFPAECPLILVYTRNEPAEISNEAPREYKRTLRVNVEIVALADDDLDDTLDAIAEKVEKAIFEDETFGGLASDTVLGETDVDIVGEGEKPIGAARITFEISYFMRMPDAPAVELSPFEKANTKIDMAPKEGNINSEDTVSLPQS